MYSSASAESLNFSWIATTRFIRAKSASRTSESVADPDRGVGPERLDEQRHPQVAAGLEVVAGEDREVGIEDLLVGEATLGQRLVLPERQLARPAAGVGYPSRSSRPAIGTSAADVGAEHLHQVEDRGRACAVPGPLIILLEVVMDAPRIEGVCFRVS